MRQTTDELLYRMTEACHAGGTADLERITTELFPILLTQDFASAVQFVSALESGRLREQLLPILVRAWATKDFASAIEWIAQLSDSVERKAAFSDACYSAAESDPAEAVRSWHAQAEADDDHVLANLVQTWAARDLVAARTWVLALAPDSLRDRAVGRLGYVMAQSEPAQAAGLIVRHLPPGPAQTEAVLSVLHQWAISDTAGASAWVQAFPPGPLADRARQELVGIGLATHSRGSR